MIVKIVLVVVQAYRLASIEKGVIQATARGSQERVSDVGLSSIRLEIVLSISKSSMLVNMC